MDVKAKSYLDQYLVLLNSRQREAIPSMSADYYCADEYNANLCAELVRMGQKTASCSMELWYSEHGEAMPQVGHLQVVTNWDGEPVCVIEITEVSTRPYSEVGEDFARAEGEGDRTLQWWREAHTRFFQAECDELSIEWHEQRLLVLERFKVVYPLD
ncbi:ASCH domain-containing protein [Vibrio natriegens]|uniref:ASCH domain-containing protein n=1 Tax=Vibrio natriegens TaxID=691 RepID=UPI001EFEC1EA|nr:ASCH domain-containing protein [Vibrio natriegens]MCG9699935.1 ASCH domain-containing protein [Vibrio natriegens]